MEALIAGNRLTLIDVARAWPGHEKVASPLEAFDRLLSNRHLQGEREAIHRDMAQWLLRGPQPVIVIDWPAGHDMVFPGKQQGSPATEALFLRQLRALVPSTWSGAG